MKIGEQTVVDHADFRVLYVCTANLCRSPMAEFLMRRALAEKWGADLAGRWQIRSVGISAVPHQPIHPYAAAALAKAGLDASAFRTRRLNRETVLDADLILTATREHRAHVVRHVPTALGRIFTIRQMGHLLSRASTLEGMDALTAGYSLIEQAENGRAMVPPRTDEEDVADPVGKSRGKFKACANLIESAIGEILRPLPKEILLGSGNRRYK